MNSFYVATLLCGLYYLGIMEFLSESWSDLDVSDWMNSYSMMVVGVLIYIIYRYYPMTMEEYFLKLYNLITKPNSIIAYTEEERAKISTTLATYTVTENSLKTAYTAYTSDSSNATQKTAAQTALAALKLLVTAEYLNARRKKIAMDTPAILLAAMNGAIVGYFDTATSLLASLDVTYTFS